MDIETISQKVFDLQTEIINNIDITIISVSIGPWELPSVHMTETEFRKHFSTYQTDPWPDHLDYKYSHFCVVGQVKFFTLSLEP